MDRLTGKVVLITGAGSGIGKAAAAGFAARGAHVILVGRRQAVLDEVAASLIAQGGKVSAYAADIAQKTEVEALVTWAIAELGQVGRASCRERV